MEADEPLAKEPEFKEPKELAEEPEFKEAEFRESEEPQELPSALPKDAEDAPGFEDSMAMESESDEPEPELEL